MVKRFVRSESSDLRWGGLVMLQQDGLSGYVKIPAITGKKARVK